MPGSADGASGAVCCEGHIYLNVPHSANVKPSWFGESVGRYEGDTLVVDTIGLNTKTVVDSFRTPHTEKLHVVERWHLIDGGNMLEVNITVDDPDAFYRPWQTYQRYQRGQRPLAEDICAENNTNLIDYHMGNDDLYRRCAGAPRLSRRAPFRQSEAVLVRRVGRPRPTWTIFAPRILKSCTSWSAGNWLTPIRSM